MQRARRDVICCVQRTGSWLLANTLTDTGYAGRPSDYFDETERETRTREWGLPPGDLIPYVRAMWDQATTPNGVLGSKLMWSNFDWLRSSLRAPAGTDAGLEFMRATFPDPQFVWLRRADKVRQVTRHFTAARDGLSGQLCPASARRLGKPATRREPRTPARPQPVLRHRLERKVCALVRDALDLPSRVAEQLMSKVGESPRGRDLLPDLRDVLVIGVTAGKAVADQANAVLGQPCLGPRLPFLGVQ
jgi:hypothetical protein